MQEAKHTPGPWKCIREGGVTKIIAPKIGNAGGPNYRVIAYKGYTGISEADGALIAAAPEMSNEGAFLLARLDEFEREINTDHLSREWNGHVAPAISRFRAAIAKVTGAS